MSDSPHGSHGIASVTPARAAELQAAVPDGEPALIVDVRERREYEALRAPGSALLPLAELVMRHGELPRDRQLLLLCRSGSRSLRATAWLLQQGFRNVANIDGGLVAWHNTGLPTRSGALAPGEGEL